MASGSSDAFVGRLLSRASWSSNPSLSPSSNVEARLLTLLFRSFLLEPNIFLTSIRFRDNWERGQDSPRIWRTGRPISSRRTPTGCVRRRRTPPRAPSPESSPLTTSRNSPALLSWDPSGIRHVAFLSSLFGVIRRTNLAKFSWMSSHLFCTSFTASSLIQWLASVLQAGTWEERNLNSWASNRIKELLKSLGSLEFSSGKAYIEEVTKCSGDAFLVTVRNKKRVGYTYEVTIKFKGDWLIQKENKKIKGHLDIPELSFGELEDLQIQVRLSEDKDLSTDDKMKICNDLRLFLAPIRKKLEVFEQELRDR
ncbi:unnamed protein product [Musa hybrid cultivar]